jgi:hypothetical protein
LSRPYAISRTPTAITLSTPARNFVMGPLLPTTPTKLDASDHRCFCWTYTDELSTVQVTCVIQ